MPIARFQMEDGRIARFEVPEGTTPEQAQTMIQQQVQGDTAPKSGSRRGRGIAAAQARDVAAEAESRLRAENPALADMIAEMGGLERFLVGAGKGFKDIGRGTGFADQASEAEQAAFQGLASVSQAAKVGEVVGQAAPFVAPGLGIGNLASVPARIAASSALGATEGGLISAGTGGDTADILAGAGLGAVIGGGSEALLPVVNSLGRQVVKKFGRKASRRGAGAASTGAGVDVGEVLVEQGIDPEDLVKAAQELDAGGDIVGNAERSAVFERLGITPTEAQRTRDIDLFVEQQDAFRKSGAVRGALDLQETQLTEQTAKVISDVGATADPSSVIDAVTDRSLRLDSEISDLYTVARDRASKVASTKRNAMGDKFVPATPNARGEPVMSLPTAADSLSRNAPINQRTEGTVAALKARMEAIGALKDGRANKKLSVNDAEDLRQFANTLFDGANPLAKKVISEFKSGLDDDVFKAAGEDVFKAARKAKTTFERGLTKQAKNKFDQNKTSLVRDILENRLAPEDTIKVIKAGSRYKGADLNDLKRFLQDGTPEDVARGQAAWNDVRGGALEFIRDTAFTGPLRADGSKSLSRAGIDKAFKAIGSGKMSVLFSKQELEFLKDLAAVSALKEPPPGTFTGTGPTGLAVKELGDRLLRNSGVPGVELAKDVVGGFADRRATRSQEQRILKLVNDSDKIQKQNAKQAFESLRKSRLGAAASSVPVAAVAATAQEEQ